MFRERHIRICYTDESGDVRPLRGAHATIAPVCVITGLVVEEGAVRDLTRGFLQLKHQRFPGLRAGGRHQLDSVLREVKGADLRRTLRATGGRRNRRHTLGFLDKLFALLEGHGVQMFGRVWIKEPNGAIDGRALYNFSVQAICTCFNRLLAEHDDHGLIIADNRSPGLNVGVAHSVFTQKFKHEGDEYPRLLEMPAFGDSRNHVGIQLADLVSSAVIFPMATYAYCTGHVQSVHVDPGFRLLSERFGQRLQRLQFRYQDDDGRWRGGLTVADRIDRQPGSRLFRPN